MTAQATKCFFATVQNKLHWAIHGQTVAEVMALRKIPMSMQDWETRLNRFIEATDQEVLQGAGRVTAEIGKAHTR